MSSRERVLHVTGPTAARGSLMEFHCESSLLVDYVRKVGALTAEPLRLLDVGCSGGIEQAFRLFGEAHLRAVGVDPNLNEVARLKNVERFPQVTYVAGFVGLPENHAFIVQRAGAGNWWGNNPWNRLSTAHAARLLADPKRSSRELTERNAWQLTQLADMDEVLGIDALVDTHLGGAVDFVKVDVDGADLAVLLSGETSLARSSTLGVCVEVNYFGTDNPTDNTFHNVDRYLRKCGFELFNLTTRRYSNAALPSRFVLNIPAQTEFGRILQGDALYLRDIGFPPATQALDSASAESLVKLACLFDIFGLPDCSAEILLAARSRLEPLIDVQHALDVLVHDHIDGHTDYVGYLARWSNDALAQILRPPIT
jgi:hypothetical protein